jgi:hypothetical protein
MVCGPAARSDGCVSANPIVVELIRGDALFVPAGWWHHVRGHALNVAVNTMWSPPVVPTMVVAAAA